MTGSAKRVLVVEHHIYIAELLETLISSQGYLAEWVLDSPDIVEVVRRYSPDLLVVDLPPTDPHESYRLLDTLRADPVTRRIPVVALTTGEPLAETAIASYNVRATVVEPCDLNQLFERIREALGEPPLHAQVPANATPPATILAQAERVLAEQSREALFRWAHRLRREPPWNARTDLRMADVLDVMPVVVEVVVAALHYGKADDFLGSHPDAVHAVRQHAGKRCAQRIPLEAVVREFSVLRDELWTTIWSGLPGPLQPTDLDTLVRAVAGTMDKVLEVTIPAYVACRDRASG